MGFPNTDSVNLNKKEGGLQHTMSQEIIIRVCTVGVGVGHGHGRNVEVGTTDVNSYSMPHDTWLHT